MVESIAPNKGAKCCCCFGCINNGSLIPQCSACGQVVPLRYVADLSWLGEELVFAGLSCCELGLSTEEMLANSSALSGGCTWELEFGCVLGPPLLTGLAVLTVTDIIEAGVILEIYLPNGGTGTGTGTGGGLTLLGRWKNFDIWECLCANWVWIDLDYLASNPPPIGCALPTRICIRPLGDCCADDREILNPMPGTLYATIINEEDCPIGGGTVIPLGWDPTLYEWSGAGVVSDCEIDIRLKCTNSQGGGCGSDFEMEITWFRPGVGTVVIPFTPGVDSSPDCSCDPFFTYFQDILNSLPCCPDPASPPGVGVRASVAVTE